MADDAEPEYTQYLMTRARSTICLYNVRYASQPQRAACTLYVGRLPFPDGCSFWMHAIQHI